MESESPWSHDLTLVEVRTTVAHMAGDIGGLKRDVRRLDDRMFQLMLMQIATIAASLASVVAAVLK